MRIESITDAVFVGSVVEEVDFGPFKGRHSHRLKERLI